MVPEHIYPHYNSHGKHVANKIRTLPKEFTAQGNFGESQLFGQNLFGGGAKVHITITEGECDAMAVYQMSGTVVGQLYLLRMELHLQSETVNKTLNILIALIILLSVLIMMR